MISLYEVLKRATKGQVFYTDRPARNVTSAASRVGKRVKTQRGMFVPNGEILNNRRLANVLRVEVLS